MQTGKFVAYSRKEKVLFLYNINNCGRVTKGKQYRSSTTKKTTVMEQNTRLALCDTSGLLKSIIDALSGKEGRYWMTVFKKALRKENPFEKRKWPKWKTITEGKYWYSYRALEAFKSSDFKINSLMPKMFEGTFFSATEKKTELVIVTPEELGFTQHTYLHEFYERAIEEYGLVLCESQIGPTLREQYTDQPDGWLFVAMKPISNPGTAFIYNLTSKNGVLGLDLGNAEKTSKYGIKVQFVFCPPVK